MTCLPKLIEQKSAFADRLGPDSTGRHRIWLLIYLMSGLFCGDALDGASPAVTPMVIRVRCRRMWVSALMRSLRNEVPLSIRRHLIVVDLPRAV